MISFQKLNYKGRLGNQLFRYAFLRTTARRLVVKFYCPPWEGDSLFLLDDSREREAQVSGIDKTYSEPRNNCGFNRQALEIEDRTDIYGYFQTDKYFEDKIQVKKWYTFREEIVSLLSAKYNHIDFSKSAGIHLRLKDIVSDPMLGMRYYIPRYNYYLQALQQLKYKENILIFSDDIELAKKYFKNLKGNIIYMEGNRDYEDLHLMSLCHDFICSVSTFSWWAAWLNTYSDKTIVVSEEGPFRPGCPTVNQDFWPNEWKRIKALRRIRDNYRLRAVTTILRNFRVLRAIFRQSKNV